MVAPPPPLATSPNNNISSAAPVSLGSDPFARARISFSSKDARRARVSSLPSAQRRLNINNAVSNGEDHDENKHILAQLASAANTNTITNHNNGVSDNYYSVPPSSSSPPPVKPRFAPPVTNNVSQKRPSNGFSNTINVNPITAEAKLASRSLPASPAGRTAATTGADTINPLHTPEIDSDAVAALESHGYAVVCELSDGSFGAVYRATRIRDGLDVAAKAVRRDRLSEEELTAVRSQAKTLGGLHHKNLVSLVEAFEHPIYIFHVFEFLHGGDLFDRLEERGRPFSERGALEVASQMLRAIGYLHARRASHRDIKLENFVFATVSTARTPVLKLIDFDLLLVRGKDEPPGATCKDMCGTVLYVPPELAAAEAYVPEEADMWALGVVLYVLLCFEMPFQGRAPKDILNEVRNATPSFGGAVWRKISRRTRELVEALLSKSGAARPSAEEALARVEAILAVPNLSVHNNMSASLRYLGARWMAGRRIRRRKEYNNNYNTSNNHSSIIQEVPLQGFEQAMMEERASQDELDGLLWSDVFESNTNDYERDTAKSRRMDSEDTMLALQKMRQQSLTKSIPMGRILGGGNNIYAHNPYQTQSEYGGIAPKRGLSESGLSRYWARHRRQRRRLRGMRNLNTGYC